MRAARGPCDSPRHQDGADLRQQLGVAIEVFGPRLPVGSRGAADGPAYTDDRASRYVAQIMVNG
jgi:hypothetical protein